MRKILNNKIFRIILSILVILSMFFLPSLLQVILETVGINNKYVIGVLSLVLYLMILVLLFLPELKDEFKIFKNNFKNILDKGFKYWIMGFFIMIVSNIVINYLVMGGNIAANEEMNRQAILENPLWYTIFSVVIIAPLLEEILFRKSIDKLFNNEKYYYILSGLLFGFAHVLADLSSILNLLYIIPYGALGVSFAIMDKKTNTTFTSILFHSVHNLLTLLLLLSIL